MRQRDSPRRLAALVGCFLVTLGAHFGLQRTAVGMALAEPSFLGEVVPWVGNLDKRALENLHESGAIRGATGWFLGCCGMLVGAYAMMLKLARGRQSPRLQSLIFAASAVCMALHALAPVMLSTDVYYYALYGRVLSVYHANPYGAAPPIPPGDPFKILVAQEYLPSWYGPLWTLISGGLALLTGEKVGLTVLAYRVVSVGCALVAGRLVWISLRRHAPERATQGLVLLTWNPLFVIESGLSAHNDSVMLVLVLAGIWLHLLGRKTWAVVALTLSALVKFLTGVLIPLYIWLWLRETSGWKARSLVVLRAGLASGGLVLVASWLARTGSDVPASHAATAPDFYAHNFHELIFKALRRGLGEDEESSRRPIYFQGWWLSAQSGMALREGPSATSPSLRELSVGDRVLVIAPQESEWARVYDATSRRRGFVDTQGFEMSSRPAVADGDEEARRLEAVPLEWETVRRANLWMRVVTWLGFAAFGLLAAWRTTNFQEFLVWSAASLLASYFLIITEIWPWYANWAVALGALAPGRWPARLAVLLSASVLTLYVTIGYQGSSPKWVFDYRSIPAFVAPLTVFGLAWFRSVFLKPRLAWPGGSC